MHAYWWTRTVVADSITYVVYCTEKINDEHHIDCGKEARQVLVENLTRAIDSIDDAMAASNCGE